jgi:hypothetical protein
LMGRESEALSRPPATRETIFNSYSVLSTPSMPDYTYGNLIAAHSEPRPGELSRMLSLWRDHFRGTQSTRPVIAFEREGSGCTGHFDGEAAELDLQPNLTDILQCVPTNAASIEQSSVEIRQIKNCWEWEQLLTGSKAEDNFGILNLQYWLTQERRKIVNAGKGAWWGMFRDRNLLGSCAAFYSDSWVRFEQLRVDLDYRCMGLGSWLVSNLTSMYSGRIITNEVLHSSWISAMYQRVGYRKVGMTFTLVGRCL